VTNEDYRRFVEATGVAAPPDWKDGRCIHGMDRYPVTSITFEQARAYARWAGKRIPTAREWERAAGGDRGLRYPWGDDVEPRRAHFDVARNCLEPVDAHPDGVSPAGCWDMMGNAAEWTLDFKLSEPILKGGSYLDDPGIIDTKTRCRTAPDRTSPLVGFRCARDAS
jgi:formylglycine-generating enzyme required for sulfatase activity